MTTMVGGSLSRHKRVYEMLCGAHLRDQLADEIDSDLAGFEIHFKMKSNIVKYKYELRIFGCLCIMKFKLKLRNILKT